ncbi:uncharacterized protein LOC124253040 [Haliotis rubra]|uniref:uncharacterized protein LOC124253040 n=1 Tax=Haliotis rubra TaxID=36100 RepID=UPI001EE52785|nr:uncharacterized protein LOC124253040 [Haliotis rubra]XP_046542713.1 uncharacterized protein LOC124253040 [Haliotis rubra]
MKLLLVAVVAVTAVMADDHHHDHHHDYTDSYKFADYLKDIEQSHEFFSMNPTEKLLYSELIMAAEKGSADLTAFIKAQTFDKIIRLIDHLDKDDIPHFEGYLAAHLTGGSIFGKRQSGSDLFNFLNELHLAHKIEDDLSDADMQVFLEILYAAEHNTLTQYIDQKGYAAVLDLMSQIDDDEVHGFDQLIIRHLEMEAKMTETTVGTIVVTSLPVVVSTAAPVVVSTAAPVVVSTAAPVVVSTVMG